MEKRDLDLRKDITTTHPDLMTGLDGLSALAEAASAAETKKRRYALVYDATSSMYPYWSLTKKVMKKLIEDIQAKTYVPFEIKIIAYRDVTVDSVPLEVTKWSADPDYLHSFLDHVSCSGGGDEPESVDIGLTEAMKEANLIILVADAQGRPESPGEREASHCGQVGCPIYAFYCDQDNPRLIANFKRLAQLSGGRASLLNDNPDVFKDILSLALSKDSGLQLEYKPSTEEGRRIQKEWEGK